MKSSLVTFKSLALLLLVPVVTFADNNAQQCAIDLCGPADTYLPIAARGTFESPIPTSVEKIISEKFDPLIQQLLELSLDATQVKLDATSLTGKKQAPKFTKNQSDLLTFFAFASRARMLGKKAMDFRDGAFQVNEEVLVKEMPDVSDKRKLEMTNLLNSYLGSGHIRTMQSFESLSLEMILKKISPETSDKDLIASFQKSAKDLQQQVGTMLFADLDQDLLNRSISLSDLNEIEKKNMKDVIFRLYSLAGLNSAWIASKFPKNPLTFQEALAITQWTDYKKEIIEILNSQEKFAKQKRTVIDFCHGRIAQAMAAAPSPLRQRKTMELLNLVKSVSKEVLPQFFSQSALSTADFWIDQTKFETPAGIDQVRNDLERRLTYEIKKSKSVLKFMQSSSKSEKEWPNLIIVLMGNRPPTDKGSQTLFSGLKEICESIRPANSFQDKSIPGGETVQLGWQTFLFPEIGAGIIAHELGHVVNGHQSLTSAQDKVGLNQVLACSNKIHSTLTTADVQTKPEQYGEEDWADRFAAEVLIRMKDRWPYSKNSACAFLEIEAPEQESSQYPDRLVFHNESGYNLHSPGLLRAIQMHSRLGGKIPSSCESIVGSQALSLIKNECK